MIITIDGPAGSGKSSAARMLAQRFGFQYLDTGAMYRAVTLAGMRRHCDFTDRSAVEALLPTIHIDMPPGRVLLNGEDVTAAIRTPEVTRASGAAADSPLVRRKLVELQRAAAAGRDMISEGRDQGTIVFPDAAYKFFLTADEQARARRRWLQLRNQGVEVALDEVLQAQRARDERDARRDIAPMVPAPDAILIDTSDLTLEQLVERMEQIIKR